MAPTDTPSNSPTIPTISPSPAPTDVPTNSPTPAPSDVPTQSPTTSKPTNKPTMSPTVSPTSPTDEPSTSPTKTPTSMDKYCGPNGSWNDNIRCYDISIDYKIIGDSPCKTPKLTYAFEADDISKNNGYYVNAKYNGSMIKQCQGIPNYNLYPYRCGTWSTWYDV